MIKKNELLVCPPPREAYGSKSLAFTLAEILITLTVLGIIAAITIPSIMHKIQDRQDITKLKKTIAIIDNALNIAIVENGPLNQWDWPYKTMYTQCSGLADNADYILNTVAKYINVNKICPSICNSGGSTCISSIINKKSNPGSSSPDDKGLNNETTNIATNGGFMQLKNGAVISFDHRYMQPTKSNPLAGTVYIDINGKKGPNKLGYDVFLIAYGNIGIMPNSNGVSGALEPQFCYNKTKLGYSCSRWILRHNNMDYKYRDVSTEW